MKKPLPRGNLSRAYTGLTSAFHQFGIREPGPHPEKQLRDTCVWTRTGGSTGEMASILAVAQGGGAGESMQRESRVGESSGVRPGMKFRQRLPPSVFRRRQRYLEVTVGNRTNPGSCWRLSGGTLWGGVKVRSSLHTWCCRVHFDFQKQLC